MASFVQLCIFYVLQTLALLEQTMSCKQLDGPLLLSPYLERKEIDKARSLSKVDKDCLEDYVPESYTGFLTVEKQLGNHMFFWFFPANDEDKDSPLLLWFNGGPTVSSMLGLFWEHGPMAVIRNETSNKNCKENPAGNRSGYTKRKYSWTGPFSMLYVDNPVGVGFSFSDSGTDGHRFTREEYTKDMVSFLKEFLQLFPEYKTRDIYIGGQSYAGKYVTSFAYAIHQVMMEGRSDFNLTGIYMGAPWVDAETQEKAHNNFFYMMGGVGYKTVLDGREKYDDFFSILRDGHMPDDDLKRHVRDICRSTPLAMDNYVTREYAPYEEIAKLLSKPEMVRAAHAGNRTFVGAHDNIELFMKFMRDKFTDSVKSELAVLMNHYKVLIYNGDYDGAVNMGMIEAALLSTPWKLQGNYNISKRSIWRRGDEVVGYYSLTGKFCRVVIHGAGHQLPKEKPEVALSMMKQFIANGCVEST